MSRNVAELVVDALIENGIEQLYCLPGVQNDDFFDALYDRQDVLPPIHTRHEQGAAYMALGAALATGKPQAFCVVPGPGFLNSCAALATAYALNAPVFALIGQIPSAAVGKGFGLLHEIPDQFGVLRGLTKHAVTIANGDEAPGLVREAFLALRSGRPRPVGLEVPANVWRMPVNAGADALSVAAPPPPAVDTNKIEEAGRLLSTAKRPMIVVGSGAQDHSSDVTRLAEMLSAPVLSFRTGHGVMSSDHDLAARGPVGHDLWRTCDAVVGIGTRLQTQTMQWGVDDDLSIIHIDIDDAELGRIHEPTVAVHADVHEALPALIAAVEGNETHRQEWRAVVRDTKARFEKIYRERLAPQLDWLTAIREALPEEGIFVDELTQVGYVSRFALPVYRPRTFLSTGYQGTLGWGFAAALGAAHARRDVPVVSISGDGGALYAIGELATAVRHGIPLTLVIFNDNAFGNVRRFQIENYNNRAIASDLASPDFVKLAESFGVEGMRVQTPDQLRHHLAHAIETSTPTVIEVPVGEFPSPWDFVLMPKVRGQ
ncbi:MAG: thiamine pyrophosphate-dependent enzyme [Hyphomicrobiaceae bacterium]